MRSRHQAIRSGVVLFLILALHITAAQAQFGNLGNLGGRPEDLLRREDVRKELELVDSQIEELKSLNEGRGDQVRDFFGGLRGLSRVEQAEKFRDALSKATEESQAKIDKILLPHQAKRLGQLAVQYQLRGGTSRTLSSSAVVDELGITDEQKTQIREASEQAQKEMNEKIAELRKEAQEKTLKALTPQQRAKWKDLVGEPFDFQ